VVSLRVGALLDLNLQNLYIPRMATATRTFSLSLGSPLLATGSLLLGRLLLRLAR